MGSLVSLVRPKIWLVVLTHLFPRFPFLPSLNSENTDLTESSSPQLGLWSLPSLLYYFLAMRVLCFHSAGPWSVLSLSLQQKVALY